MQVVDFGIDCIRGCRTLYEKGSRDEDDKVELYASNLTEANKVLQDALKQQSQPGAAAAKLVRLAVDASATSSELKIELNKLKLSKSQGIRRAGEAFRISLKGLIKSGMIEKLEQKVELQEKVLKSTLVKELYMQTGRDSATRKAEFEKLSQIQQNAIDRILANQKIIIAEATSEVTREIRAAEDRLTVWLKAQDVVVANHYDVQPNLIRNQQIDACKEGS